MEIFDPFNLLFNAGLVALLMYNVVRTATSGPGHLSGIEVRSFLVGAVSSLIQAGILLVIPKNIITVPLLLALYAGANYLLIRSRRSNDDVLLHCRTTRVVLIAMPIILPFFIPEVGDILLSLGRMDWLR